MEDRRLAEDELKKDKNKSDDQILTDVYDELLNSNRELPPRVTSRDIYLDLENIKHGLKRLSGFFYNQSRASTKLVRIGILISIITLFFTLTNIFPIVYFYQNLTNPLMMAFVGSIFLLVASFIGIIKSLINFKSGKSSLAISCFAFIGTLLLGIAIFSTFIK